MKSPFKFLDSYTKDDREIFFGRDSEIEELYHRVFESKLMLVYGVSGTGKSSLIHCGLANKFPGDWTGCRWIYAEAAIFLKVVLLLLKTALITKQTGEIGLLHLSLKKAVRSIYLDHYNQFSSYSDQFEELFIFGDKKREKPLSRL